MTDLNALHLKKGFICDMDGVIYRGNTLLPGVSEFVEWLEKKREEISFSDQFQRALPQGAPAEIGPHGS